MASEWQYRTEARYPFQLWVAFPGMAIVQIKNVYGESRIGRAGDFWWGYEAGNPEGVIVKARRLDRIKHQ
jgi:hypothetical protein